MLNNVFGKLDDYTELLLPDNMLQDTGFLHLLNTTDAISDEQYKEVELIGWLYQFYISERKDEVFASFKKKKKALAFLSFLLIVGSFGMAEAGKKKPFIQSTAIVDNDGSRLNNGKKVYLENCAYCHGNDGKKAYRGAPDLSGGRNEGYTAQVVTDGKKGDIGVMPAYGGTLSFDEIADVALYIAAMGKTTPAPVTE